MYQAISPAAPLLPEGGDRERSINGNIAGPSLLGALSPKFAVTDAGRSRVASVASADDATRKPGAHASTPSYESFHYPTPDSAVYEAAEGAKTVWAYRFRTLNRWFMNVLIAAGVGLIATFITWAVQELTDLRFKLLDHLIGLEKGGSAPFGTALSGFGAASLGYGLLAALPVAYMEPVAAGSGISEIKTILNGVILPRVLHFRTLLIKVIGITFSVASGLPVGREGPMIHSGAAVAAGVSQGKSSTLGFDTRWSIYKEFRNDREKRDFVACGAAAGVAAAFNAPIGGTLFAIEEGASHWQRVLVWRTFFCAIVTAWIVAVFLSGLGGNWGHLSSLGMFSFGTFAHGETLSWSAWELPFFIALGAAAGLLGAGFIALQHKISLFRLKYVPVSSPHLRVVEVAVLIVFKIVLEFVLAVAVNECRPRPIDSQYSQYLQSFYCDSASYNELASFFMVPSEDAIRQLFHSSDNFSLLSLSIFFCVYLLLVCLTYGIAVPSGVFIPSLLAGSAFGRIVGELLTMVLPKDYAINAGVYSLVGAAAMLGGVTRMTISLAVIVLETTGNYEYALPIISALLVTRFVGNWFNEGIYDLHIHLRKWPLLPDHLPKVRARHLRACDVMAKPPIVLQEIESVGNVFDVLRHTEHNVFPVVYSAEMMQAHPRLGSFAGMITRRQLAVLLHRRAFHPELPTMPLRDIVRNPTPSAIAAFTISTSGVRVSTSATSLTAAMLAAGGSAAAGVATAASGPAVAGARQAAQAADGSSGVAGTATGGRASQRVLPPMTYGGVGGTIAGAPAESSTSFDSLPLVIPAASDGSSGDAMVVRRSHSHHHQTHRRSSAFDSIFTDDTADDLLGYQPPTAAALAGAASTTTADDAARAATTIVVPTSASSRRPSGAFVADEDKSARGTRSLSSSGIPTSRRPSFRRARPTGVHPGLGAVADATTSRAGDPTAAAAAAVSASHSRPPAVAAVSTSSVTAGLHASFRRMTPTAAAGSSGTGAAAAKSPQVRLRLPSVSGAGAADDLYTAVQAMTSNRSHDNLARLAEGADDDASIATSSVVRASRAGSATNVAHLTAEAAVAAAVSGGAAGKDSLRSPRHAPGRERASGSAPAVAGAAGGAGGVGTGENAYMVSVHQGNGADTLRFVMDDDIVELLYQDEPLIKQADFDQHYPRYPDVSKMRISDLQRRMFVDLRPYLNAAPYTVHVHAPISRAFELFTSLGLHQLPVINDCHDVVGVLSRHDFTDDHLARCVEAKQSRERERCSVALDEHIE